MGWISDRHMKQGGSIGGKRKGRTYAKEGAPLRKIVGMVVYYGNLFQPNRVLLECGHEADAWGSVRARCPSCKKATAVPDPAPLEAPKDSNPEG